MLIPLKELYDKYNLDIRGVIHIGAYNAEELPAYRECNVPKVIWIEALPNLAKKLQERFRDDDTQMVINAAISNIYETVDFIVTNNEASSSLLELGTHLKHHPRVWEEERIRVDTVPMTDIIGKYKIDMTGYNFLNIDIQGAELKALEGMSSHLNAIDYLYLEVNREYIYTDCCLIGELDAFLVDFERVETLWTKYNWGDCFLVRKTLL